MDNASLLNDMLNNFKPNETTEDELDIINELYKSCQNLIPTISRVAGDVQNSELLGKYKPQLIIFWDDFRASTYRLISSTTGPTAT